MMTIRTTLLNLRVHDVRRQMRRGYEVGYVEIRHSDAGEETTIVWTRPPSLDDLPETEIPF